MPIVRFSIPIYLPKWAHSVGRKLKRGLGQNGADRINLWGDRDIEWSFVAAHLPEGPGRALDFGNGGSHLHLIAARRGFGVTALDLEAHRFYWHHPSATFLQGDVLGREFQSEFLDVIINCSAVEHVGLAGRYGVKHERSDGDIEAMSRLREMLKPSGVMLLTIPVGTDAVFSPFCRIYGERRLPLLLSGFQVRHEEYWMKDADNTWIQQTRNIALAFRASVTSWDPAKNCYALACFVLATSQGPKNGSARELEGQNAAT